MSNLTLDQWTKNVCFIITSYFCTKCNSIYTHIWLLTTTDPLLWKAKYVCLSNCIHLYSELQLIHQNCICIIYMYYLNWYRNMRLIPVFRDPESILILGQVTQYGNPYLICIIIILVELSYTDELKTWSIDFSECMVYCTTKNETSLNVSSVPFLILSACSQRDFVISLNSFGVFFLCCVLCLTIKLKL